MRFKVALRIGNQKKLHQKNSVFTTQKQPCKTSRYVLRGCFYLNFFYRNFILQKPELHRLDLSRMLPLPVSIFQVGLNINWHNFFGLAFR